MQMDVLIENALYLLALLNPVSKVMFLATYEPWLNRQQIVELSWKSSVAALIILTVLAAAGQMILTDIFRIELYSLRITGGLILFFIGWHAVREGRFMNRRHQSIKQDFTELSLVPLAAPLIAGPGTIAAAISSTAEFGLGLTALALLLAVAINFVFMLFSLTINHVFERTHLLGPLIRLTGLIIASVAVQMVITGLRDSNLW